MKHRGFFSEGVLEVPSYMKSTNVPSARTAMAYGAEYDGEYADSENGTTKVYAITREKWCRMFI